jgi:hypothetical protein
LILGVQRIDSLDAFPLEHHSEADLVKTRLISNGQAFVNLGKIHHRNYKGIAFRLERGDIKKTFVNGRIMIDQTMFREVNAAYNRPRIDKLKANDNPSMPSLEFFTWDEFGSGPRKKVLLDKADDEETLTADDFLFCSPTVLGFGLEHNLRFCLSALIWISGVAVADIADIEWNPERFQQLVIKEDRGKAILSLANYHTRGGQCSFDNYVHGKGRGFVIPLVRYIPNFVLSEEF